MEKNTTNIQETVSTTIKPNVYEMSLSASAQEKTKEEVLKKLKEAKDQINKVLENVKVSENSKVENLRVQESKDKKGKSKGFYGYLNLSFKSTEVDSAHDTFFALMKLDSVTVYQPRFNLENVNEIKFDLMKTAKQQCDSTLQKECEIMGVDYKKLDIMNWASSFSHQSDTRQQYEVAAVRSMTVTASMNRAEDNDDMDLKINDIKVTLTLRVTYGMQTV